MIPIVSLLLVFTFLLSVAGLFVLIWSISTGQFSMGPDAPKVIFDKNEIGHPEDPVSTGEKHKALHAHLNEQDGYNSASDYVGNSDLQRRFPFLFVIANFPGVHFGVQHAIVNWWFAHNKNGPCVIFPGKLISTNGWCTSWNKKA